MENVGLRPVRDSLTGTDEIVAYLAHVDLGEDAEMEDDQYVIYMDGKKVLVPNKAFEFAVHIEDTLLDIKNRVLGTRGISQMLIGLI